MRIVLKSYWPAIIWFILSSIAFCLPEQVIPKHDWFAIIELDKWIHVGLFSVLIFLWCLPLFHKPTVQPSLTKLFIWITLGGFLYGIIMEVIQHFFIPHRSFDWGDIAADALGCLLGLFLVRRQWKQ
jgi:hypothetical protein